MQSSLEIKAEINRIKAKLSASSDRDIQEALQFKLESLEEQFKAAVEREETEKSEAEDVASSDPVEIDRIALERDLRKAHGLIGAGKPDEAFAVVKHLQEIAPDDPEVLELRADMLVHKRDFANALPLLKKARKLAPKNVAIERKLAEVAMKSTNLGSLDDQLRAAESDLPFIGDGDITATATAATILSLILPGSGHLVIGKTVKGICYMVTWLLLVGFLVWEESVFKGLVGLVGGKENVNISMFPLITAFLAVGIHLVAISECAAIAKRIGPRGKPPEKPKPPVDLPFE
jgi:tetratricopeptide (TPR) repeat protein